MILEYLKYPQLCIKTFYKIPILMALPHNLSAMFDDAVSNYKQKIMIQTSAIKFIHRTIIALGSLSKLFIKMPQNIF